MTTEAKTGLPEKLAKKIWAATEKASTELAKKQPFCTYTPPPKGFKRKMLAEYRTIVRAALNALKR